MQASVGKLALPEAVKRVAIQQLGIAERAHQRDAGREAADVQQSLQSLRESCHRTVVPIQLPIGPRPMRSWPPAAISAIVSTNTGYASKREHALALARANPALTQEQIGAQTGAARSTVGGG